MSIYYGLVPDLYAPLLILALSRMTLTTGEPIIPYKRIALPFTLAHPALLIRSWLRGTNVEMLTISDA